MSIRFDAAADRLTYTGSIPVPTGGMTITAWVKIVNDRNDFSCWFRVYNGALSTVVTSETDGDGTSGNNYFTAGGSASNAVAMGTGVWRAVAISHDTGTTGKAYVRVGTTTTVSSATVSSSTPAGICIGGRDSGDANEWFDGEIAQVRIWSAELTQTQIEAEWASSTPVISANAYANWPLGTATDLVDTVAARTLTTPNGAGQTTGTDGPPNTAAVSLPRMAPPGRIAPGGLWLPIIGDTTVSAAAGSTTANPGVAAGTGAAGAPTANVSAAPAQAAGTGAAGAPTANVAAAPAQAAGAGAAQAPTANVSAAPAQAAGTGSAGAPTANISTNAGAATGTGAALAPTANVSAAPAQAAGTGSAGAPAANVSAVPAQAAGTGSALAPTANVSAFPAVAAGTGAALNPTANADGNTTAQPAAATGTGSAGSPTANVSATTSAASGTGSALAPTVVVSPAPATASGTGTARAPTANITAPAGVGTGTGAALAPVSTVGALPGAATGTGAALAPSITVGAQPGVAAGTGTAYNPTASDGGVVDATATAGAATGTGTAWNPTVTIQNARPNAGWYELLGVLRSGRVVDDTERFDCPRCGVRYDVSTHGQLGCRFDGFRPDRTAAGAGGAGRRDWGGLNAALDDTPTPARRDYLPGWGPTE